MNQRRAHSQTWARHSLLAVLLVLLGLFHAAAALKPIAITDLNRTSAVDFEREVLPILKDNCLACHNATKPKAGLVLETPQTILKGGDSGPGVVPGKPGESLLLRSAAHQLEDLVMPPPENKVAARALTPAELGLLQLWIAQGATGEVRTLAPITWQPMPAALGAIYSVALTADGQFAACGRANQLFLYHLPTTQLVARLHAPALDGAHRDNVNALAFSPDGERLASGGFREVKLWRRVQPREQVKFVANVPIEAAAMSSDGRWIALATNGQVGLWHGDGKWVRSLAVAAPVSELQFSSDGAHVSALSSNRLLVWNAQNGAPAGMAEITNATVYAWFSARQLAVGTREGAVRLWDIGSKTLSAVAEWTAHSNAVFVLTRGGTNLITADTDGIIRVWDAKQKRSVFETKTTAAVLGLSARDGGSLFAVAITNGAQIWKVGEAKPLALLQGDRARLDALAAAEREVTFAKSEIEFRKGAVKTAEAAHTNVLARHKKATETNAVTTKLLAEKATALTNALTTQRDAQMQIDELEPYVRELVEAVFAVERVATNAAAMAKVAKDAGTRDAETLAADALAKSNVLATTKAALEAMPNEAKAKQKTATEKLVAARKAVADAEKDFRRAELNKSATENEVKLAGEALRKAEEELAGIKRRLSDDEAALGRANERLAKAQERAAAAEQPIRKIHFDADGHRVWTVNAAGRAQNWAAENGFACETLPLKHVRDALPMPDGRLLVITENSAVLWSVAPTWELERTLGSGHEKSTITDRVNALRFTPDGKELISGGGEPSRGGEMKVWRVNDGAFVREFPNVHSDSVFALDVSADGRWLVSGGADRFARAIDFTSGKVVRAFEGHTHHVLGVALNRSARALMTAGADNVIKVWDFTTGERKKNVTGFGKEITSAHFVGVSDQALVTSGDAQVVLVNEAGAKGRAFNGASDYVYACAASANGKVIVAGGADGVLRVWNGVDGKMLHAFSRPEPTMAKQ